MKTSFQFGLATLAVLFLLCPDTSFGRGFGGRRGGGSRGGARRGGAARSPSYSGARQSRSRRTTGSRGSTRSILRQSSSSVTIGGSRGRVSGTRGSAGGRAGGVKVTTPGGRTVTKGGASGAVRTPRGGAAGQKRGGSVSRSRSSASGVQGRRIATDAGFGRYAGGVRVGGRTTVGHRTRAVAPRTRRAHAIGVRRGVYVGHPGYRGWFGGGWFAQHPGAWRARRLTRAIIWTSVTWNALTNWWGWGSTTVAAPTYYYDYGNTVVYEGDTVYYDSKPAATAGEYYDQAGDIAKKGDVEVNDEEEWRSLGVWAMVQGKESQSNKMLQLAVNKDGVIRGNHYDALTESTLPIQGSVDKKTQRAAWTVGKNDKVVYETGIHNLTGEETQMLIHFGKKTTQQWTLVKLEAPEEEPH